MKKLQNFSNFSQNKLYENLIGDTWQKVVAYFKKKYRNLAWLFYGLFLKKNNKLPKNKVEIILPDGFNVKDLGFKKSNQWLKDISNESALFEEVIDLEHPDPNIRNVGVDGLIKKISRVFDMNIKRVDDKKPRSKNHALFIWGAPGIGKTEILRQVANEANAIVIEWHLSQIEPTDFRGVPKIENVKGSNDTKDERTVVKLPELFPDSDTEVPGIIFFDEMNRAPQMVLSAALSLCLGGTLGNYSLPERWIVVAAGNRAIDLGDATPTVIEPALANRFSHVNYAPSIEDWIKWAYKKDHINPDLIAFLKHKPQYYHKLDPDEEPQAWPSPRSWDLASEEEYFARGEKWSNKLSSDELSEIYTDNVGSEAATAFNAYLELKKVYNENDVKGVYTKGAKAKKLPTRADQSYAASCSIASYKKGEKITEKEFANLIEFIKSIPNFEVKTPILSEVKEYHPYLKTEEPYKTMWWNYVKEWHKDLKEME